MQPSDSTDLRAFAAELQRSRIYDAAFNQLIAELNPQLKRPYLVKLIIEEADQERYEIVHGGLR